MLKVGLFFKVEIAKVIVVKDLVKKIHYGCGGVISDEYRSRALPWPGRAAENSWAPLIFDGRYAADNLSARCRGHAGLFNCCSAFSCLILFRFRLPLNISRQQLLFMLVPEFQNSI